MKFILGLLSFFGLFGTMSAIMSAEELTNGMWTVPYLGDGEGSETGFDFDWSRATMWQENSTEAQALEKRCTPDPWDLPGHPNERLRKRCNMIPLRRLVDCRTRDLNMTQVILAKENFFRWIRQSESEGCVPKKTCKFFLWDDAVVGSCTTGHNNPTCEKEWYLSMDLLDWRCGWSRSASLKITAWKKSYFRLHRKDWIS